LIAAVPPRLSGTNLERAADHNQRVTLHAIRVGKALTRVDLARITGLTAPAVANITRRLREEGLIDVAGQRRGARGQPPTTFVVRPDACYAVGVNIDRDHVTVVLVDFTGRTVARVCRDVAFALPAQVRALYRDSIGAMLAQAGVDPAKLVGVGVAVPDQLGSVDLPGRPAGYDAWERTDLADLFAEPYDLPVFTENDAAAAAMGEMQFGAGQSHGNFFYLLISSGLGGGLVVDGAYVRGASGRSGELGFLRDPVSGEEVQQFVSLSGLSRHLAAGGYDPTAVHAAGPAPAELDTALQAWVEQAALRLVEPLAAVNCLVNPAVILVGGRLPATLVERLAVRSNALMQAASGRLPAVAPMARAALSDDAPAVGAAILPFSHFLLPKPSALWKAPAIAE
jgi:predicted NBD/HSP70 family sugar kinase